jgi:hypothetical protein
MGERDVPTDHTSAIFTKLAVYENILQQTAVVDFIRVHKNLSPAFAGM